MAKHFFTLYALLAVTLIFSSWGEDQVLQYYGNAPDVADESALKVMIATLRPRLKSANEQETKDIIFSVGRAAGVNLDIIPIGDIAGQAILKTLKDGLAVRTDDSLGQLWTMMMLNDSTVLTMKTVAPVNHRSVAEWMLTIIFYAVIALVVMIWLWPISRDLRKLETAAAGFGRRNWFFNVDIKPRSQIYPLAQTFNKMALRIEELIESNKDMTNAVAHEIKTPLARMKFEIELGRQNTSIEDARRSLANMEKDVADIDRLVSATLSYAILERAEVMLNFDYHDFSKLVPAIIAQVSDSSTALKFDISVMPNAERVRCDVNLFETLLNNLLYNAVRYARSIVRISFHADNQWNCLFVEDDGKGVPSAERQRVFDPFVQLEPGVSRGACFGLGLAIVKRIAEWHGGDVSLSESSLGGAKFSVLWPVNPADVQ